MGHHQGKIMTPSKGYYIGVSVTLRDVAAAVEGDPDCSQRAKREIVVTGPSKRLIRQKSYRHRERLGLNVRHQEQQANQD